MRKITGGEVVGKCDGGGGVGGGSGDFGDVVW